MEIHQCKLIVDLTIISDNEILLVKYKNESEYDNQKGWFLPNDLLEKFEHPDDSAVRILDQQIGLKNTDTKLNHVESFQGKDKSWHIAFHYKAEINDNTEIKTSDKIKEYDFFEVNELPDRKEFSHNGWGLFTIKAVTGE